MAQTALPSVYPPEGSFNFSVIHADLSCMTPGARIHYTLDGSDPTPESPVYNRDEGLIPLHGVHGETVSRTIRAYAEADGLAPSEIVSFTWHFQCPAEGVYRHSVLREPTADTAGLIRIEDFDLDKMYLIVGSERAVLIDAGYESKGDLPGLCRALVGDAIPVDLVVAHGHPDHIMQIPNFQKAGCTVYLPAKDLHAAEQFGVSLPEGTTKDINRETRLDLGNTVLSVYEIPGHTPGSVVLLDEKTGDLYASDAFGSNRRYVPDSAWLQLEPMCTMESCLRTLDAFLAETRGKLKRILSGHNDEILDAEAYLLTLRQAFLQAAKGGNASLTPSLRSAAESFGSGSATRVGDWRLDPYWIAANVRFLTDADRDADPPRYAKGFTPQ